MTAPDGAADDGVPDNRATGGGGATGGGATGGGATGGGETRNGATGNGATDDGATDDGATDTTVDRPDNDGPDNDGSVVVGTATAANVIEGWAELFQALSDANRLKILLAVHYSPRINVSDIAAAVGMGANATSHALAGLRVRGIVRSERVGRERRWSIANERIHSLLHDVGAAHPPHQSTD